MTSSRAARAADLELPRQIPTAKLTQQVGLTEIGVEYDCQATRGRKIWGGVVPYDQPWTIGANPAAKIRFSKDVTIGDKVVPAGTYWLLAKPGKINWTFMLNKSPEVIASTRDYKPELDVVRIKASSKPAPHRERITFLFSDLTDEKASLDLEWDNVRVSVPVQVNTSRQIEAAIGRLDDSWRSFANAARYMLETKKDYDAGLKYISQSLALQSLEHMQDWYSLWIKGSLLAAKGEFGQASELAQNAYDLAKKSGGPFPLEPELLKSIKEWKGRRPFEKERASVAHESETPAVFGPTVVSTDTPRPTTEPPPQGIDKAAGDPPTPTPTAPSEAAPASDSPLRRARLRHR